MENHSFKTMDYINPEMTKHEQYRIHGNIIRQLREGHSIVCPECGQGKIIPPKPNYSYFRCDACNFAININ